MSDLAGKWSAAATGRKRYGGFVLGVETGARSNPGCRCRPGSPDMCGACQRRADAIEDRELWDEPPEGWEP